MMAKFLLCTGKTLSETSAIKQNKTDFVVKLAMRVMIQTSTHKQPENTHVMILVHQIHILIVPMYH